MGSLFSESSEEAYLLSSIPLPDASHSNFPHWLHMVRGGRGAGEILHHRLPVSEKRAGENSNNPGGHHIFCLEHSKIF